MLNDSEASQPPKRSFANAQDDAISLRCLNPIYLPSINNKNDEKMTPLRAKQRAEGFYAEG